MKTEEKFAEKEFAKKITGYLDKSGAALKQGTAYRLQGARQRALAALSPQLAPQLAHETPLTARALSTAGTGTKSGNGSRWSPLIDARLWIFLLVVVGGGFYFSHWQTVQQIRELEELDSGILSSDLPLDAYLDRGFQNWLYRAER